MNEDIVAVSLFSGAGGLDIASMMAGVPVISSTDFDSDCVETLKANEDYFGDTEIFEGDLHEIESDVFKSIVEKRKPKKFIVIGGAPCQPFSKAGYWVTNQVRRGINDPRATLVNEYLRVVTDLQPDGFVFENVESLLHPTNRVIVDTFISIIEEAGYKYKIVRANAQLIPNAAIPTFETGTRHRTAQRVARETGNIVVAISQRRNIITVYKGELKYVLRESSVILGRANQAVQTLEKYVSVLERVINNLNLLEFQDLTTLFDVVSAIQRTEMVMRIVEEIRIYILELGNEGRLISMQLNELIRHIERDGIFLIRDYSFTDRDYNEIY